MISWDDDGRPIVRMHAAGPQTMADLDAHLARLGSYLDRTERLGEPFALLMTSSGVRRAEPGTTKRQMEWMAAHRGALGRGLAGMAGVVAAEDLAHYRSSTAKLVAHVAFPMAVFATERECLDWLVERLAGSRNR